MKNELIAELWRGIREKTAVERARLVYIRFRINMKLVMKLVEAEEGSNGQPS